MSALKTWHVSGTVTASTYVGDFEAATAEEAFEKAWGEADVGVCWACADKVSDPEVNDLHAWTDDGDEASTEDRRVVLDDLRAALTRAVVAEQWAVACTLIANVGGVYDDEDWGDKLPDGRPFVGWRLSEAIGTVRDFASLPSAAAVVAERMGEP